MRVLMILCFMFSLFSMNLSAFDGDSWIVSGDNVRVRSKASAQASIVDSVKAGTVVRVVSKTDKRDKFLEKDEYGFFWYNAVLPNGKKGWIYGKFLYQMNGDRFTTDPTIFAKAFTINGKEYYFGIAEEEAAPVFDEETGMPGSEIHALPFFVEEGKSEALLLKSVNVHTFWDENLKFPYYFKQTDSEGGMQHVASIEISEKNKSATVRIDFTYDTQDSGGTFYILAKKENNYLLITEYSKKEER
jgi:hypothetical protein